jgi:hypothetical protein
MKSISEESLFQGQYSSPRPLESESEMLTSRSVGLAKGTERKHHSVSQDSR